MSKTTNKTLLSIVPAQEPHAAEYIQVPASRVGPVSLLFGDENAPELIAMPLATFETPLWPSVGRGAKVSRAIGGIRATLLKDGMTRSIVLKAASAQVANKLVHQWREDALIRKRAESTSRFAMLEDWSVRIIGRNIYMRMSFATAEAAGHNMATKASDAVMDYLCSHYPVEHISVSGNMCVDKKVSAVNNILGRGKSVTVEGVIPESQCRSFLKTTPEAIHKLNIDKNYLGSLAAGSLCSANAHYANMLLGFYLATGQDAANIVEGSQGITATDLVTTPEGQTGLYFSVNLPNIIVGTVGSGKDSEGVRKNLALVGCAQEQPEPKNFSKSQRLAMVVAASVWCGELSLMAAQTNPGELMSTHVLFERGTTR